MNNLWAFLLYLIVGIYLMYCFVTFIEFCWQAYLFYRERSGSSEGDEKDNRNA